MCLAPMFSTASVHPSTANERYAFHGLHSAAVNYGSVQVFFAKFAWTMCLVLGLPNMVAEYAVETGLFGAFIHLFTTKEKCKKFQERTLFPSIYGTSKITSKSRFVAREGILNSLASLASFRVARFLPPENPSYEKKPRETKRSFVSASATFLRLLVDFR